MNTALKRFVFSVGMAMLTLLVVQSNSAKANTLDAPIKVVNYQDVARVNEPVTGGIPIPREAGIYSTESLEIVDPGGNPVPSQFVVTARWGGSPEDASKPIKWVLATFFVNLSEKGTETYHLTTGNNTTAQGIRIDENSERITVSTGAADFEISKMRFSLFESVRMDGEVVAGSNGRGLWVTDEAGNTYTSVNDTPLVAVEEQGPVRVVLRVKGNLRSNNGTALLGYQAYLYFYAGKSYVRALVTLVNRNPALPRGDGGGYDVFDFYGQNSVTFQEMGAGIHFAAGTEPGYLYPARDGERTGAMHHSLRVYQDSSGTDQWNLYTSSDNPRPNSYCRFRGYRVHLDGAQHETGDHFAGWLDIAGNSGGVCVGIPLFWQTFPKGLSADSQGEVEANIFPADYAGAYNFRVGEQKTTEIFFYFHPVGEKTTEIASTATALLNPMLPVPSFQWLSESGAIQETVRASDSVQLYSKLYNQLGGDFYRLSPLEIYDYYNDRTIFEDPQYNGPYSTYYPYHSLWESSARFPSSKDLFNFYGSLAVGYGNLPLDYETHEGKAGPFNDKYNMDYGAWLQFLRKGDVRWREMAEALSRYSEQLMLNDVETEYDTYRWKNAVFGHAEHDELGNMNGQRNYLGPVLDTCFGAPGALLYYYLTGYPLSREFVQKVADYTYNFYLQDGTPRYRLYGDPFGVNNGNSSVTSQPREFAHVLHNLTAGFLLTGDTRYKELAQGMVEFFNPRKEIWINGPVPGSSSYFQSWALLMYLHAMGGYASALSQFGLTEDELKVREALVGYIDWFVRYGSGERNGNYCTYYYWRLNGVQEDGDALVNNWMYEAADVYAYAYKYTGDQRYLDLAGRLFETANHNQGYEGDTLTYCTAKEAVNAARFGHVYLYYDSSGEPEEENHSPVADAGEDRSVAGGERVILDGGGSHDPDGDPLYYQWSQSPEDELRVTLQNPNSDRSEFTAPTVTSDTALHFTLTVSDGISEPASDSVTITVEKAPESDPESNGTIVLMEGLSLTPDGDPYSGTQDLYIVSGVEGNYGAADQLIAYNSYIPAWRFLVRFELSGIELPENAVITSAVLKLTRLQQRYGPSRRVLYRVGHPWVEGTGTYGERSDGATWSTCDGHNPWSTPGGDYQDLPLSWSEETEVDAPAGTESFDITDLVKGWIRGEIPNYGVLVTIPDNYTYTATYYASSENGDLKARPELVITYRREAEENANLLQNPRADEGLAHWNGNGGTGEEEGNPFFLLEIPGDKLYQDISLAGVPEVETGGLRVRVSATVSSDRDHADDGLPYLYGYIFGTEDSPELINTYMTTKTVKGSQWTRLAMEYPISRESTKLRIFMCSSLKMESESHSIARFDNLKVSILLPDGTPYQAP